ncbi:MAG: hypothetical protein H6839_02880 [Planctomycetes bacterium]|nr:hypothetical protein [Planctomycetota bacterium]
MAWKAFGFDWMVNAWRWTLHRHAGRQLWCGRDVTGHAPTKKQQRELARLNDGTHEGWLRFNRRLRELTSAPNKLKPVVQSDGTDVQDFEQTAEAKWAAAPDSIRFKALQIAFEIQAGPPGMLSHHDNDTLAFRPVNTLYPRKDWRPNGVAGSWKSAATRNAMRSFESTMTALLGACRAWENGHRIPKANWQSILSAAPVIQFADLSDTPPSPGDFDGVGFSYKPKALVEANDWPTIIREAARASCGSFLTFLLFSRAGESWGFNARLKSCRHPGCGDFFVGDRRTVRCIHHSTSPPKGPGKAASDRTARQARKQEWELTKGDRPARADLLAQWHNRAARNPLIQKFLNRKFKRGVTGVTCSFDKYLKTRADLP